MYTDIQTGESGRRGFQLPGGPGSLPGLQGRHRECMQKTGLHRFRVSNTC